MPRALPTLPIMLATPKLKPQNNPHNTPDDKLKIDVDVPVRRKQPMIATPTVLTSRQLNLRCGAALTISGQIAVRCIQA